MRVLVDGENLRHQLAHILKQHQKINDKHAYFRFDLVGFLRESLHVALVDVTYYTTRIKQPTQKVPIKLQKRITSISEANRRWVADLTNQKITVVKAGYLRVRESGACVHCSKKTLVLQEKGVDVRVATDLVIASHDKPQKTVALASSDSDLVPAMQAAHRDGLPVIYFCYAGWLNRSVSSQAQKTITFDDAMVLKYFKGNNNG
ncbi:MAG TPA: NYN domain-containing protein [Verrucomicrobiae bacterium]|nr:NYN domain-containing protein [Verrucomicrobiae bacterium]